MGKKTFKWTGNQLGFKKKKWGVIGPPHIIPIYLYVKKNPWFHVDKTLPTQDEHGNKNDKKEKQIGSTNAKLD